MAAFLLAARYGEVLNPYLGVIVLSINVVAYFLAFHYFTLAKGYSPVIGLLLPFLLIAGAIILLLLPAKRLPETGAISANAQGTHQKRTVNRSGTSRTLNGWQRIGVVLSVLWVGAVIGYFGYEATGNIEQPMFVKFVWSIPQDHGHGIALSDMKVTRSLLLGRLFSAITLPIITGWVLAYLGVYTGRWVRAGFIKD